jgi:hypothetical protein
MKRVFLSLVLFFAMAASSLAGNYHSDETLANGDTLIAAKTGSYTGITAITVFAKTTTATSFYIYNGDHNILGSSAKPLIVDLDGIDAPAGWSMAYNPEAWVWTDAAEDIKIYTSADDGAIEVIITYKHDIIRE